MAHFFLPELDANISVPSQNALWFNNDKKIILGISDGILIDEQSLTKGVSSIPDIWARPLLFQSAIRDHSKHPLKKRCIQEWRALLSLLALHKIKPELAALEVVAVKLNTEKFSTALKNLTPKPVRLERNVVYEWTNVLMIRFDGIPLGAFSPSTLVYAGVDYNKKLKDKPFPFKDKDGFLAPPEKKEDGLEYMGEWLYSLQKNLYQLFYSDQENPDHEVTGNLNELISTWLKEIRITLGVKENDPINVKTHKVSEDRIDVKGLTPFLNDYKIYERLLHPLRRDESVKGDLLISDILLQSSRSKQLKIAVITEKLLSEQVNIWNEIRPKSLGDNAKVIIERFFNEGSGTQINTVDIGEEGGLWIRPEIYFLSNKLLRAKEGYILNQAEEELNIGAKYILPFKKEILDFFSPTEIREILAPVCRDDSGMVKFSFTLPIGNSMHKIERTYKQKATQPSEGEIVETDVPIIEIFPDYLGKSWRRYYLFQGNAESFFVNPILEQKRTITDYRERDFKDSDTAQKVRIFEIIGDHCFPEAAEITNEKKVSLGLILISKKENTQGLKHNWTLGIDFGTSNTNVYKNRGAADTAERWCYEFPNYYRSLTLSDPVLRDSILEEYFFPTRKVSLPIPSTLKIYNLARRNSMVLDYFIYYPIKYKFPENVLSDIKWDGAGERKTEYFLESLLFLLLIEVVKNGVAQVQLACSYPKAFSQTNISVFQSEWEDVFNKLLKSDDNNVNRILDMHSGRVEDNEKKIIIKKPVFKTEGIAAGEYFASELTIPKIEERANKEIAAICLDVGGGTTDISIWYFNSIEFDSSVILAGRQLSNLLQINNRVRELLFSKEAAIALEEKKNESSYFSARLNLVLKNEEENVQKMLVKHANNKDIQWLRQIIALEFGALSFYAAEVCVSTNEKVGGLLTRISNDGIHLHWGGNAAKLINWIDFGRYNRDGIASKILNAMFYNCLNDKTLDKRAVKPKALLQLQSPGHKSEASGGLVVMDLEKGNGHGSGVLSPDAEPDYNMPDESDMEQKFYTGIVCGENIELTDRKVLFFEPIVNNDLYDQNNRTKFKTTTLERLVRFVEVLNFFGIKNGLFTEDAKIVLGETEKRIIRDGVMKEFIKMQSLKESQRLIEPVFIIEIKLLLEIIKSKMN
ncbi:MAG: hypothetical protein WKF97_05045 [Chitinophagaceae bacterium]